MRISDWSSDVCSSDLLIAGKADTPAYAKKLRALGGEDERIRFSFDFIPDDALQLYLSAADLVVIPFRKATNSGSVALALSFPRTAAVPDIPALIGSASCRERVCE